MRNIITFLLIAVFVEHDLQAHHSYTKTPVSKETATKADPDNIELARNYRYEEHKDYDPVKYFKLKLLVTLDGKDFETDDVQVYLRLHQSDDALGWTVSERTELFLQYGKWYQLYVEHPGYNMVNIAVFTHIPPQHIGYILPVDLQKDGENKRAGTLMYDYRIKEIVYTKHN